MAEIKIDIPGTSFPSHGNDSLKEIFEKIEREKKDYDQVRESYDELPDPEPPPKPAPIRKEENDG